MKKRMLSLICVLLLAANLVSAAAVEPRASNYFWFTEVWATPLEGGEILVEFDINATHTMLEVGAKRVYIYEEQTDGSYDNVYTFWSDDYYDDMIDTNTAFANNEVTYQGIIGRKYYATVAMYAKDSSGSEMMYDDTNIVTAVATP